MYIFQFTNENSFLDNLLEIGRKSKIVKKIEVGDKSTQSMLIDGSGYYINDLENNVQYFVDYEVNKAPKQLKRP